MVTWAALGEVIRSILKGRTLGALRLRRAAQPHACGFITAAPRDEDDKEALVPFQNISTSAMVVKRAQGRGFLYPARTPKR